uniref:Gag-pol polyprotein n=1 Tax=Solanum tuberosum TaxID=4113 RepID=M1DG07_SOLTU
MVDNPGYLYLHHKMMQAKWLFPIHARTFNALMSFGLHRFMMRIQEIKVINRRFVDTIAVRVSFGVRNAPKVQPQGEVTNHKFRDAIRMLSQVVTNQARPQRENRQDVVDTSKIRELGSDMESSWVSNQGQIAGHDSKVEF